MLNFKNISFVYPIYVKHLHEQIQTNTMQTEMLTTLRNRRRSCYSQDSTLCQFISCSILTLTNALSVFVF